MRRTTDTEKVGKALDSRRVGQKEVLTNAKLRFTTKKSRISSGLTCQIENDTGGSKTLISLSAKDFPRNRAVDKSIP